MQEIKETETICERDQAHILREIVVMEVGRMAAEAAETGVDIEARTGALEDRAEGLHRAIRRRDFAPAAPAVRAAGDRLSLFVRFPLPDRFARTVCTTLRSLVELELEVFEDGRDPLEGAGDLFTRHQITLTDGQLPKAIQLSHALEKALEICPYEMSRKLAVTAGLLDAFAGDIRLERLPGIIEEFMLWISRLPRTHGRAHGKNRYTGEEAAKTPPSKQEEIDRADAQDAAFFAEYAARDDISLAQKRAELSDLLTPRITQTNLERQLDRIHQLLEIARAFLGYTGPMRVTSYPALTRLMKRDDERRRAANPLHIRKTMPKIRLRWAGQRIKTLLTSPVYRGCSGPQRRCNPGRHIIRDGLYWVPLILLTMGTRPAEVLQLKKCDLIERDVWCLRLCWTSEQPGKTRDSQRIVPIPQVLIDLGFITWILEKEKPTDLLFPEMCDAKSTPTQILSKRVLTVRKRLGIVSFHEDLYALRKTLSSALWAGGVALAERQMIIGHVSSTTIGKHYTEASMSELKALLDRADYKIVVGYSGPHRHPVIEDCLLVSGKLARTEIVLDEHGVLGAVRILRADDGKQLEAIALRDAEMPARPGWRGLKTLDWAEAPDAIADVLSEYTIIPHEQENARLAFEHLLALASASSESKLSDRKATRQDTSPAAVQGRVRGRSLPAQHAGAAVAA